MKNSMSQARLPESSSQPQALIGLNYWLRKTIWEMVGLNWNWVGAVLGLRLWMGRAMDGTREKQVLVLSWGRGCVCTGHGAELA